MAYFLHQINCILSLGPLKTERRIFFRYPIHCAAVGFRLTPAIIALLYERNIYKIYYFSFESKTFKYLNSVSTRFPLKVAIWLDVIRNRITCKRSKSNMSGALKGFLTAKELKSYFRIVATATYKQSKINCDN